MGQYFSMELSPTLGTAGAGLVLLYLLRYPLIIEPLRSLVQKNPRPPYKKVYQTAPSIDAKVQVKTKQGLVEGYCTANDPNLARFRGIPFASIPG